MKGRKRKRMKTLSPLFLLYEKKARRANSKNVNEDCAACNTVRCAVISEWTFASGRLVHGIHLACDSSHVHFPLCIIVYMTILLYSRLYRCIFIRFAHFHAFVIRVLLGYILFRCSTILVSLLPNRATYENHFTEKLRSPRNNSRYFLTCS